MKTKAERKENTQCLPQGATNYNLWTKFSELPIL